MLFESPLTCRWPPPMITCATLVAVGSLTPRVPVNVANGITGLIPVHPWQPAQAPSYTALPCDSVDAALSANSAGAGACFGSGRSEVETPGTVRKYVTIAATSLGFR